MSFDNATIAAMLGTGPGAWLITTGILMGLKDRLGNMWPDKANKITSVALPVILVEATIASLGATLWYEYVVGFAVGLLASQGASKTQQGYDNRIAAEKSTVVAEKRPVGRPKKG